MEEYILEGKDISSNEQIEKHAEWVKKFLPKYPEITKENIPAATQLFTPDWIVRYMVENSLGRLWLEGHPDVKSQLLPTEGEQSAYAAGNREPEDTKWHYYLEKPSKNRKCRHSLPRFARSTPH